MTVDLRFEVEDGPDIPKPVSDCQVWIGCLAAYNAGALHGAWVDATDADGMHDAGKEIIRTSPAWKLNGHAEELFVADYEGFPSGVIRELGEYPSYETVANVATALEDHGAALGDWLDSLDYGFDLSASDLGDQFLEHYRGEWDSEEAYAMDCICELGWAGLEGPQVEQILSYLDMESITCELFQHGNHTFVNGHVFEDEV